MDWLPNDIILRFRVDIRNHSFCGILPEGYMAWQLWIQPLKGFGQGYATISTCNTAYQIVVNEDGPYNVLAIGQKV